MPVSNANEDDIRQKLVARIHLTRTHRQSMDDVQVMAEALLALNAAYDKIAALQRDKERMDWISTNALLKPHKGTPGRERINRERLNRAIDSNIHATRLQEQEDARIAEEMRNRADK